MTYKLLYCNCGWTYSENALQVGLKNECPLCKRPLLFVAGPPKEVRSFCTKEGLRIPVDLFVDGIAEERK